MKLEVLKLFGSRYAIFDLDGEHDPVEVSSPQELRDHLRNRGLSGQQIAKAIEGLETGLRQIWLVIKPGAP
jgi:hypothetical protein